MAARNRTSAESEKYQQYSYSEKIARARGEKRNIDVSREITSREGGEGEGEENLLYPPVVEGGHGGLRTAHIFAALPRSYGIVYLRHSSRYNCRIIDVSMELCRINVDLVSVLMSSMTSVACIWQNNGAAK